MGGYEKNAAYENKDAFFQKYYFNYHLGRLGDYSNFLRKHIEKTDEVSSVGSGRSASELYLLEDGYNIVCSDLCRLPCHEETKKLFPDYRFCTLNILEGPAENRYDGLVVLRGVDC